MRLSSQAKIAQQWLESQIGYLYLNSVFQSVDKEEGIWYRSDLRRPLGNNWVIIGLAKELGCPSLQGLELEEYDKNRIDIEIRFLKKVTSKPEE